MILTILVEKCRDCNSVKVLFEAKISTLSSVVEAEIIQRFVKKCGHCKIRAAVNKQLLHKITTRTTVNFSE